jgi:hypothetical protein
VAGCHLTRGLLNRAQLCSYYPVEKFWQKRRNPHLAAIERQLWCLAGNGTYSRVSRGAELLPPDHA